MFFLIKNIYDVAGNPCGIDELFHDGDGGCCCIWGGGIDKFVCGPISGDWLFHNGDGIAVRPFIGGTDWVGGADIPLRIACDEKLCEAVIGLLCIAFKRNKNFKNIKK